MAFSSSITARAMAASRLVRAYTTGASPFQRITVVGGGQMGAGIAQVSATKGLAVTLVDTSDTALERGRKYMTKSLQRVAKKKHADDAAAQAAFVDDTLARIVLTTDEARGVAEADLVVEAIVENLAVKQKLFAQLAEHAPEGAVLASNTSSLPIGKIAEPLSAARRAQFIGLHFFNPVPQMKLVEVVKTAEADAQVLERATQYVRAIGKEPAMCQDTPGFIVNRLLVPYMIEAVRMLERGVASARDIDTAMKLGAGYPMGPFELGDYVGLDVLKFIMDGWHKEGGEGLTGSEMTKPSKILDELVAAGKLGVKAGEGFYNYKK